VRYSSWMNITGFPAITLPIGRAPQCPGCPDGGAASAPPHLPAAIQLVCQPWHDAALLRTGAVLEEGLRAAGLGVAPPQLMVNPLVKLPQPTKGKKSVVGGK